MGIISSLKNAQKNTLYKPTEGEAITWTYDATPGVVDVLVMNSAGYDCLKAVPLPYLEVHMTNIEQSKIKSVTATVCVGMICVWGSIYI